MSMSVNVCGVRDLSIYFEKMLAVKEACDIAKIDYPKDVHVFFGTDAVESRDYLTREMETMKIDYNKPYVEGSDVYEVIISKLPEDVKKIRFEISY